MSVDADIEISVVTTPIDISIALVQPSSIDILTEEPQTIEVTTSGPPGQNGKGVLVLGVGDPLPPDIPVETVIVRYVRS